MIKRNINNIFAIIVALFIFSVELSAQIVSPFNKLYLTDTSSEYSFIVSGHFHGASSNASTFPASTLQANIDTLNLLHPSFLMSLGDMFLDVNQSYIDHYQRSLFDKLKMPLFNAVGNHDCSNGNMYEKIFGAEYFTFKKDSELFIVLNTEVNDGSIKNNQLSFLTDVLKKETYCKNIFIFSHRPVWAENNERYKKLFNGNTRTMFGNNNFEEIVRPLLMNYSKEKKIYWISGSLGGGPASFFYDIEPETNITFMQTAIRDQEHDAALQVNVKNGNVSFSGISFTGQKMDLIENYTIAYWSNTLAPDQKFNYRLLPFLTLQMILHYYFWVGFVTALFVIMIWVLFKRKIKNSKKDIT